MYVTYVITVKDANGSWEETNAETLDNCTQRAVERRAREIIQNFNNTLRPAELPRTFVSVRVVSVEDKEPELEVYEFCDECGEPIGYCVC